MDCVFCRIVAGGETAFILGEDDDTLWFLNKTQTAKGHTLVIPKAHYPDLLSAPADVATAVMRGAQAAARLLTERIGAEGVSLFQFNGQAGWQDVFHLHIHVVPRKEGDNFTPAWRPEPLSLEELASVAVEVGAAPRGRHLGH